MRAKVKLMSALAFGLLITAAQILDAAAAQPFRVDLALVPSDSIVGIPVSARFKITNTGAVAVAFPRRAELLVRNARGHEFAAWCNTREVLELKEWPATIGAGETKVVWLRTDGTFYTPAWLSDGRFFEPGSRFELQAFFGDSWAASETINPPTSMEELRSKGLPSSVAVWSVREPTGIDAQAWKIMTSDGGWSSTHLLSSSGQAIGRRILSEYPTSAYAGWIATTGVGKTSAERAQMLRDWLEKAPVDAYTERRQLILAIHEIAAAGIGPDDPAKSAAHKAAASAILRHLLETTTDGDIKGRARYYLGFDEIPNPSTGQEIKQ